MRGRPVVICSIFSFFGYPRQPSLMCCRDFSEKCWSRSCFPIQALKGGTIVLTVGATLVGATYAVGVSVYGSGAAVEITAPLRNVRAEAL